MENKTIFINNNDIKRTWYLVDAKGKTLGELATKIASILKGKHKIYYSRHQDVGDFVVVINSSLVKVSKDKNEKKMYYWHSGYIGGLKSMSFEKMIAKKPYYPIMKAVKGMLPKNKLGSVFLKRLKVYTDDQHKHEAQKLVELK